MANTRSSRLTVGKSLAMGFFAVIIFGALIATIASLQLGKVNSEIQVLVNTRMVNVATASHIKDNLSLQAMNVRNMLLLADDIQLLEQKNRIETLRVDTGKQFKLLDEAVTIPRVRELLQRALDGRNNYNEAVNKVMALAVAHQKDAGRDALLKEAVPAHQAVFAALNALSESQQQLMRETAGSAQTTASDTRALMLAIGLVAVVVGSLIAWWLTRSITTQLGGEPASASAVAQEIASGNLAAAVPVRPGDTNSLMATMHTMRSSLAEVVQQVRRSSESVASASGQIAQANMDLSSRTEEQASALQQTAASMEQLNSTVRQNADNALQANQLAKSASEVAARGGSAVGDAVKTMQGISESSHKIADIIGVIDGIAFQTNILALNAAVEAARAGEQGRGFAVVASEVRALAGRSAEAAKQIKSLITDSVERIESGTAHVNTAGETMKEVVQAIHRVTDLMGEISAASHEQSQGVTQVGEAVSQMDLVTQQNASLVEEMAASAASLENQAQELVKAIQVFTLEHTPSQGAAPPVQHAVRYAAPPSKAAAPRPSPVSAPKKTAAAQRKLPARALEPVTEAAGEWENF
ncbi:MAG: hypothetical protein BGO13_03880 [Burkholderiales bacterium 66-5]|nr:MAG: hypothetical protein BGO13_03880 [Burkholderiales bacterium 66-5]